MPKLSLSVEKSKQVIGDWEKLKQERADYLEEGGKVLFMNLFEKCPESKAIFGFAKSINPRSANLLKSPRFRRHAKFLMKMIEKTVDMLGTTTTTSSSDEEGGNGRGKMLTEVLTDLGRKHVSYGVNPEFFPFMTESILAMLDETIGNPHKDAWNEVFAFLINGMTAGYQRIQKVNLKADKEACMDIWKRLSKVPDYRAKGGVQLFQHLFEICPETKALFGFPLDIDPRSPELLDSKRFAFHASFLMEMMEKTVEMLGEADETIEKNLLALGQRHVSFGVKADHFPFMTKSLIFMLKELLGSDFSTTDEQAFEIVMAVLIADLVRGQRSVDKDLAGHQKEVVTASWAKLTQTPDFEKRCGILLFQNLFELCPESKLLFGFPLSIDPRSEALLKNDRFLAHATFLLSMIGKSVGFLGEDDDELTKTMLELGKKHTTYGVKAEYFPFMTEAIVKMMTEVLGGEFTEEDQKSWESILAILIADIVRGERLLDLGLCATHKNVTAKNWEQIASIDDYDEICGMIVFENLFRECPDAKPLFGFSKDYSEEELKYSKRMLVHSSFIIEMVEKALKMLGKDDKELGTFMEDLGRKHIAYNVKPEYLQYMVDSIVRMLKTILGDHGTQPLSPADEAAWQNVLDTLVANMKKAQRELEMKKIADTMVI